MRKLFIFIVCQIFIIFNIGLTYANIGDIGHWRDSIGGQIPGTSFGGFDFDNEIRNDGIYTKPNDSTIEVTEAGDYLIIATTHDEDTSNGRYNSQLTISQIAGNGNVFNSHYTGYSRDNSENESWTRGIGIIIGATANSQFQVQKRRDTDAPNGGSVVNSSDLQIVKINQTNYGIYGIGGTGNIYGGTTPNTVDLTNVLSQSDTASIEGNTASDTITIKGNNKTYLIAWSVSFDSGNSRTQRIGHLEYNNNDSLSTRSYCYNRNSSNEYCGLGSMDIIRTSTADINLQTEIYRGNGVSADQGGANVDGNLATDGNGKIIVIEMPDSLEIFESEDSVGLQDITTAQNLNIARDVTINDSSSFTKASDTTVNVVNTSDILSWANIWTARSDVSSGRRQTSYGSIVVNGIEQTIGRHGNYSRGNQGNQDTFAMSFHPAGIFTPNSGETLGVNSTPLAGGEAGGNDRTQAGTLGFFAINLDTINKPPSNINLSNTTVEEGNSIGTIIGKLTTTDVNNYDTHNYSLSCSTAGSDDFSFNISGDTLITNTVFDYDTKSSFDICIRTDDGNGGIFDKNFNIDISPIITNLTNENTWNGGFCYDFQVQNITNQDITNWVLGLKLNDGNITSSWGGNFSDIGGEYEITSDSTNNDKIDSGNSLTFGFCGSGNGGIENIFLKSFTPISGIGLQDYTIQENGLEAQVTTSSSWGNGYCRDILITNNSNETITNWELFFDLDQSLSSSSSANFTQDGITYKITPLSWNQELDPTESTTINFCTNGVNVDYQWQFSSISTGNNDFIGPTISSYYPTDNEILTTGNFNFTFSYNDESDIDTNSDNLFLYKWDGFNWGNDISGNFINESNKVITNISANYPVNNLENGEYKVVFNISDTNGNLSSQTIFFNINIEEEISNNIDFEDIDDESKYTVTDGTWTRTINNPYSGLYSLESGNNTDNSSSCFEVSKTNNSGDTISFYKNVSSENNYDFLRFYINGVQEGEWSGEVSWSNEIYNLNSGNNTFRWCYEKDYSVSNGQDKAWVDDIVFSSPSNPGGIDGISLWLKADKGTSTVVDGNNLNLWSDQSGNGSDAIAGVAPIYLNNDNDNLNFNPLIDFDGNSQYMQNLNNGGNSHSYYTVIVPDETVNGQLPGQTPFGFDCDTGTLSSGSCGLKFSGIVLGAFTVAINDEVITHAIGSSTSWRSAQIGSASYEAGKPMLVAFNENQTGNGTEIYEKGVALNNYDANTYQSLSNADYSIGRSMDSNYRFYYNGKIAEIINYDRSLNETERKQIESYLAIKYGITLGNGNIDYIFSDGISKIWDSVTAGAYNKDIFGIARDDTSSLSQVKSKSINNENIVSIEAINEGTNIFPNFVDINDLESLIISNNGNSNIWTTNDNLSGFYTLDRKWKVQENGEVGNTKLSLNIENLNFNIPDLSSGTNYYFIYDTNNNSDLSDETPISMTNEGNNIWSISNLNLNDGSIFTFATEASLNNLPTDITLSNDNINENNSVGALIGNFSTQDLDLSDTHTYSFEIGAGDDDNNIFTISGNNLYIQTSADFEIKNKYYIRVKTDDQNGGVFQREFIININNVGETTDTIINFEQIDDENKYTLTSGVWTRVTSLANEGIYSLQSNNSGQANTQSCFEIENTINATGTITFDYNVSSQANGDYLRFYIDNIEEQNWSGETGWGTYTKNDITIGTHIYKWCYIKNGNTNSGRDNVYIDYITLDSSVADITGPTIDSINHNNGKLLPGGNHDIIINYSDLESGIDTNSIDIGLFKWNGSTWGNDLSATGFDSNFENITSSQASYKTNNLSFGKYQIVFNVSDTFGNNTTYTSIFYIDEVELNISNSQVDLGDLQINNDNFSSSDLIITVKTLGASFDLIMNKANNLNYNSIEIADWNGSSGYGFDQDPFTNTINNISTNQVLASQAKNINTSGEKNIYIYTIRLGANIGEEQAAGEYEAELNFKLDLNY